MTRRDDAAGIGAKIMTRLTSKRKCVSKILPWSHRSWMMRKSMHG